MHRKFVKVLRCTLVFTAVAITVLSQSWPARAQEQNGDAVGGTETCPTGWYHFQSADHTPTNPVYDDWNSPNYYQQLDSDYSYNRVFARGYVINPNAPVYGLSAYQAHGTGSWTDSWQFTCSDQNASVISFKVSVRGAIRCTSSGNCHEATTNGFYFAGFGNAIGEGQIQYYYSHSSGTKTYHSKVVGERTTSGGFSGTVTLTNGPGGTFATGPYTWNSTADGNINVSDISTFSTSGGNDRNASLTAQIDGWASAEFSDYSAGPMEGTATVTLSSVSLTKN